MTTSSPTGRSRLANGLCRRARRRWSWPAIRPPRSPSLMAREQLADPADWRGTGRQAGGVAVANARGRRAGHCGHVAQRTLSGTGRTPRQRLPLHPATRTRARAGRGTLRHEFAGTDARCCEAICNPMLDANADTLVLGCTHYPFLDKAIRAIAGDRLTLIDTSVAIARQLGTAARSAWFAGRARSRVAIRMCRAFTPPAMARRSGNSSRRCSGSMSTLNTS